MNHRAQVCILAGDFLCTLACDFQHTCLRMNHRAQVCPLACNFQHTCLIMNHRAACYITLMNVIFKVKHVQALWPWESCLLCHSDECNFQSQTGLERAACYVTLMNVIFKVKHVHFLKHFSYAWIRLFFIRHLSTGLSLVIVRPRGRELRYPFPW